MWDSAWYRVEPWVLLLEGGGLQFWDLRLYSYLTTPQMLEAELPLGL